MASVAGVQPAPRVYIGKGKSGEEIVTLGQFSRTGVVGDLKSCRKDEFVGESHKHIRLPDEKRKSIFSTDPSWIDITTVSHVTTLDRARKITTGEAFTFIGGKKLIGKNSKKLNLGQLSWWGIGVSDEQVDSL